MREEFPYLKRKRGRPRKSPPKELETNKQYPRYRHMRYVDSTTHVPKRQSQWWISFQCSGKLTDEHQVELVIPIAEVVCPYDPSLVIAHAINFDRACRNTWPDWMPTQEPIYTTSVYLA